MATSGAARTDAGLMAELYSRITAADDPAAARRVTAADRVDAVRRLAAAGGIDTLVPLLPLLLNHEGRPYALDHHYQFEPLFRTRLPARSVLMTGRQVSKTTTEASSAVVMAAAVPRFRQLFVTPLFEQVRRLSSNYVRPFIDQSPVRDLLVTTSTEKSVLQRSFRNDSMLQFTFALLDADRSRGIKSDFVRWDEVQDANRDHFPVVEECMSHSEWGLVQYAGTPKTPENTLTGLWRGSSQAEWFVPCRACGRWNIPSTEYDLDRMIGPYWEPAEGEQFLGLVCANPACGRPVDPAGGRWVHRHPDRRWDFAGYHIPQPIMHIHYSRPEKWAQLLAKREGSGNYTPDRYANEVLGEPCGHGIQIVGHDDLRRAATLPWANNPREPDPEVMRRLDQYHYRVLALDWGGGGKRTARTTNEQISLTAMALLGWLPNGRIHCLWGRRLHTPHDHLREAAECMAAFRRFRCHLLAHDYTGAGVLRETFLVQAGLPVEKLIPVAYVRAAASAPMTFKPATDAHPRNHYTADKTRTLLYTCTAIKTRQLQFFKSDYVSPDNPGLLNDFLGLVEEKVATRHASDIYTISRHDLMPDDFAQAVNIGCASLWYVNKRWPQVADGKFGPLTAAQMTAAAGRGGSGWEAAADAEGGYRAVS